jgi:SAM-dependent methyltransferase
VIDRPPVERFSAHADAYDLNRPHYPSEAIDALLDGLGDPASLTVADSGAGTGISSRLLAARGATVFAIEPNTAMREHAQNNPRISWIAGTAEATGLPDQSVDLAACFQAFHWFDAHDAVEEFKRISRRRIGMLQYERDERESFTAAYGEIVRSFSIEPVEVRRARALEDFTRLSGANCVRSAYPFTQNLDRERLIGRMASTSYLPRTGREADRMRRMAGELFDRFAEDGCVSIAMICYVLYADA